MGKGSITRLILSDFKNRHSGETIIVCGCGVSLRKLTKPSECITIGVNDVGRLFDPDYLVVVNPEKQFSGDRFSYVRNSKSKYLFTQLALGISHPSIVKFNLGKRGGTDFLDPNVLHYTRNSPYVALCLAIHMGAKRIGLIGVDFTDHHFFDQTGRHTLASDLRRIDLEYGKLSEACAQQEIEIVNLSMESRLTTVPKMNLHTFFEHGATGLSETNSGLNILSYATTPLAGVPAILSRCINETTPHNSRCVWARSSYGNGVGFTGDVEWTKSPADSDVLIKEADVVIVHNGKVASQHLSLIDHKPVITMAHNYKWNVDCRYVDQGLPGVVVGQYQATLPEFEDWHVVPNPMPLWEPDYQPGQKPDRITVAYTPSGKHERFPSTHRLFWHSKGYQTTMDVLDRLARTHSVGLEVIRNGQVSHVESLAMKRRAHIVIDECVTGSYHRNSLEGLAAGCVVINGMHLRIGVIEAFQTCAGIGATDTPFVYADLKSLESTLKSLIEKGAQTLTTEGASNSVWMRDHWNLTSQWDRFWLPMIEKALESHSQPTPGRAVTNERPLTRQLSQAPRDISLQGKMSVVVPTGGSDRLSLVTHVLQTVKFFPEVGEIILVEMGESPGAKESLSGLYNRYLFIHSTGPFHKARALNAGLAISSKEFVLYLDGDVIVPNGLLPAALLELADRRLDCLVPWTTVKFLSKEDSSKILEGCLDYRVASSVNTIETRDGCRGAAVLVRRDFALSCRGMCEEFRGWGGEDDAWFLLASHIGSAAVTQRKDHHLFHLYHKGAAGYEGQDPHNSNPHYAENLANIRLMQKLRDSDALLEQFPLPQYFRPPWPDCLEIGVVRDLNDPIEVKISVQLRNFMLERYGVKIHELSAANSSANSISGFELSTAFVFNLKEHLADDSHHKLLGNINELNKAELRAITLPIFQHVVEQVCLAECFAF